MAPGFFEELLPLITDEFMGDPDTRPLVPLFVEEACRRRKGFIPMCTAMIVELSKDDNPSVLSNTMRATAVLVRKGLIAICSDDGDVAEEDQQEMWESLRDTAASLRQHSRHENASVRNSAVMLLQMLAITFTVSDDADVEAEDKNEEDEDVFSLHSIPPCHAFLDYSEMKKLGQDCVQQLLDLLDAEKAAPLQTMTVAINCLGRVARHSPQLIATVEPVLTKTCNPDFGQALGLIKWEAASLRSTVKSTLLALLKLPRCAAYAAVLVEHLSSLGAVTQAEAARRIMEKARSQYGRAAGSKRGAVNRQTDPRLQGDANKRARLGEAPLIDLSRIPDGKPPEEWGPDLVSELILAAMKNFPPALPPHLIDVADTPLSMWPDRLAHPGVHARVDGLDAVERGEEGDGGSPESTQTATSIRNKALMNAKPLPKATVKALAEDALLRLLEGESSGWASRTGVVARLMAASDIGGQDIESDLVAHVLAAYAQRHSLAIQYLHEVYMQDNMAQARAPTAGKGKKEKGDKEVVPTRYTHVLHSLVDGLIKVACSGEGEVGAADGQRHLIKLLSDVPVIDIGTMNRVTKLCDDENKQLRQAGMSCLRALIVHQNAWRLDCLSRLLKYTVAKDEGIRSPAIRLVANKLFGLSYLTQHIRDFAIANLRKACQLPHDEALDPSRKEVSMRDPGSVKQEGGEGEVVRHYMHLFMALCAQKHEMLHALIETYVQATSGVRSAVQASITDMIKAIGAESSVLLSIMADVPKGAELLLLAFVRTLTEQGNPGQHKRLLDAIKALYARMGDARFMIYICSALSRSEVEELLPRMVALPQVGVKAALHRLLHSRGSALTPEKLMIALHKLQPAKDLTIKKIAEAIELCFNDRAVFTTQVLAVVVQQLLEQNPLPELYMRTVLLALKASPSLTDFVMGILHRLIAKQIWTMPTLWKGFVRCCRQTLPRSVGVLVQLPPPQLAKAVHECEELGEPLALFIKDQRNQGYNVPAQIIKVVEPWLGGHGGGSGRRSDDEATGSAEGEREEVTEVAAEKMEDAR